MFLHQIDLTTALRPYLLPGEALIFVQDGVGLYEGKYKIPQYQNGHAYLTSHRVCYVDNEDPRQNAVGVDLKDVEKTEFYAGFLKSSGKVTLTPAANKRGSMQPRGQSPQIATGAGRRESSSHSVAPSPAPRTSATWVCVICTFSNLIPQGFDPASANSRTYLPPCESCGIKPELIHVVKAAIQAYRQSAASSDQSNDVQSPSSNTKKQTTKIICPRCTFANHLSMRQCEICDTSLATAPDPRLDLTRHEIRAASPGPALVNLSLNDESIKCIKLSFRVGGEKVFFERINTAMQQRKWLLHGAPPIPQPNEQSANGDNSSASDQKVRKLVGIAGLELREQTQRKNNELIIGNAFEDLEALITSAKDIIALAESFSSTAKADGSVSAEADSLVSQSVSQSLGLITTKDMLGSDSLYISELSRNLAEFLTDDTKGVLKKEGGIISLVDLWSVFNQARNGVELVSPVDFEHAARMWEQLKLPVRLRRFKSGLLVVQGSDRTDEKTIASIMSWLKDLHEFPPEEPVPWDWRTYGRGVTVQETAVRFGWSMGVTTEELEMAEEKGVLCRDQGLDGIRFWENFITEDPPQV
ncbi:Vps36-domain-containing protein [Microthyrium microscopicum]|uniref:Vacuolar protein-sorting-associated protein 36 n=1 Tax=Microthyrium microscopicum TaxID=703497 RepID=A0A6A6TUJ0_9PEZI|nr:Vps36-domain-containing protein [Microthyrium microscopicum]